MISRINNTSDCRILFLLCCFIFPRTERVGRKQRVTLLVGTAVKLAVIIHRGWRQYEKFTIPTTSCNSRKVESLGFLARRSRSWRIGENNYRADKSLSNERDVSSWSRSARADLTQRGNKETSETIERKKERFGVFWRMDLVIDRGARRFVSNVVQIDLSRLRYETVFSRRNLFLWHISKFYSHCNEIIIVIILLRRPTCRRVFPFGKFCRCNRDKRVTRP